MQSCHKTWAEESYYKENHMTMFKSPTQNKNKKDRTKQNQNQKKTKISYSR